MISFNDFVTQRDLEFHSILFEDVDGLFSELTESYLVEKSAVAPLTTQLWGSIECKQSDSEDDCFQKGKAVYEKAYDLAKKSIDKLERGLKKAATKSKDAKVVVDIKELDSFLEKVLIRGKRAENITDVLRSSVIAATPDDVEEIAKQIRKDFIVVEYEYKGKKATTTETYGKDGTPNVASKKDTSGYGYHGSYHFLVKIDGIIAEIQVMTRKLWAYKKEAHDIYKSLRAAGETVEKAKEEAVKRLSRDIFSAANKHNKFLMARKRG